MNDEMNQKLGEAVISLEMTVNEINAMLNAFNMPLQTPTTIFVELLMKVQNQAVPQLEKLKAALEAVKNADGVPKDLEERN